MNKLFHLDNPFFSLMGKVFDLLVLNVLWLLLCIPMITIVPATTALYYSVVKVVRKERGYAIQEFWYSFKQNLREGSFCSVVVIIVLFILWIDFRYTLLLLQQENMIGSAFLVVFLIISILICAIFMYLCPILSRFEMSLIGLFKMAFVMSAKHILTTFGLIGFFAIVLFGTYIIRPCIFIFPVAGVLLSSFLIEPVLKKYMPAKKSDKQEEYDGKDEWYLE